MFPNVKDNGTTTFITVHRLVLLFTSWYHLIPLFLAWVAGILGGSLKNGAAMQQRYRTELKELETSQMEALLVIKDSNNCLLPRIILCYSKLTNKALQRCLILKTHVQFKHTLWTLLKLLLHQYVQFWTLVSDYGHKYLVLDTHVWFWTLVSDFGH